MGRLALSADLMSGMTIWGWTPSWGIGGTHICKLAEMRCIFYKIRSSEIGGSPQVSGSMIRSCILSIIVRAMNRYRCSPAGLISIGMRFRKCASERLLLPKSEYGSLRRISFLTQAYIMRSRQRLSAGLRSKLLFRMNRIAGSSSWLRSLMWKNCFNPG
ncbi:hypothetical protein D3C77_526100 [compost metagenome]